MFRFISQEQIKESARRKAVINECLSVLIHARKCENDKCESKRCTSMKKVWRHYNGCAENKKPCPKCPFCSSVVSLLQYHANDCHDNLCTMPRCEELKDGYVKWQKTQQTFLSNLVKFRLASVPTVIKGQCQKFINPPVTNSDNIENDLPNESVTISEDTTREGTMQWLLN